MDARKASELFEELESGVDDSLRDVLPRCEDDLQASLLLTAMGALLLSRGLSFIVLHQAQNVTMDTLQASVTAGTKATLDLVDEHQLPMAALMRARVYAAMSRFASNLVAAATDATEFGGEA